MKLQQLRCLAAVVQNDLNLTAAANKLATTQPAVSKQLKSLEGELGFRIFTRRGRAFTKVTPAGERIVMYALRALREVQNIKGVSEEFKHEDRGELSIGTTHTQARYVLPTVIQKFCEQYPDVKFHLHQGTSEQIAEMGKLGRIDRDRFPGHVPGICPAAVLSVAASHRCSQGASAGAGRHANA
jgi:LysR family transcriptional regulator, cys regulon transcriptional activator